MSASVCNCEPESNFFGNVNLFLCSLHKAWLVLMRSTLNAVSESHKEHLEFHAWRGLSTSLKISLPAEKKFIIHFTSTGEYFGFYTEGNKDAIVNFAGMPIRSSYFLETSHINPIYRDVFLIKPQILSSDPNYRGCL